MTATIEHRATTSALDVALELHRAGVVVVPVRADGSKRPALAGWKQYQSVPPSLDDVEYWFGRQDALGVGIITGGISGNLLMLEIEGHGVDQLSKIRAYAEAVGQLDLFTRATTGWVELSPSGGYHWFIRTESEPPGNQKLARRPATPEELTANPADRIKVLTETRGTGGFVVVAPSAGTVHDSGLPWVRLLGGPATAPTLTDEEVVDLLRMFAILDGMPAPAPAAPRDQTAFSATTSTSLGTFEGLAPGDDFEAKTPWQDILDGWTLIYTAGDGTSYWRRPGKTQGQASATTGRADDRDRLYVFSTSTDFPTEEPITKFHAYAILHHGGNHSAAASALRGKGYGSIQSNPSPARAASSTAQPAENTQTPSQEYPPAARPRAKPIPLDETVRVFRRWLGEDYDTDALLAVLAASACHQLNGDPVWLLLLSGSGNAKTETVQALESSGATSTISSVGALLSATSTKEKTKDATGGLLRKLGPTGLLVVKDVTSILSMDRTARGEVLAALREIHDGRWSRNVGTDGGRTLEWEGRLVVIGAVTTAWDRAHDVIASMGDRFVVVRMDSTQGRQAAGRQAIGNTGHEVQMRTELAAATAGALANVDPTRPPAALTATETEVLLEAANIVTLARTGVDYDYRGDVIDAHAPEMPTRFAKELAQVVRGGIALGLSRERALRLAVRCARDSMPPMRLAIVDDVAAHPYTATKDVRRRLGKPRATVDRQLQALHMLGVLTVDEEPTVHRGQETTQWRYTLAPDIDPRAIDADLVPDLL